MTPREQLIAYLATLAALVLVVIGGLIIAAMAPSLLGKFEAFGFGTVTGGLIGVLRIPAARGGNVEKADTVNQGGAS
jgi:hypothetical protein